MKMIINKDNLKSIARRIVEAKPKVTSPATEKIKNDAKTILWER